MPLSPKTEQMMQMQMPGADQEQQLFEQSFSEMAQSLLMNKVPELAGDVVTFKIIDSDIDKGAAVGAFIVQRPSGLVYIPAVLTDNQVKPLEIMYAKEGDAFLPLSQEWINEVDRGAVQSLGDGTKIPETLYTDVDIRNLVVPPITGRYSFASATDLKLPEVLARVDARAKQKFAQLLEQDVGLLKVAVAIYGSQALKDAFSTQEKTAEDASKVTEPTGNLYIAKRSTDPREFTKMFGPNAPTAMKGVALKGFYAQDTRKDLKRPVDTESQVKLQEVRAPGAYRLYKNDGTAVTALVVPNPMEFENPFKYDLAIGPRQTSDNRRKLKQESRYYLDDVELGNGRAEKIEYAGITEDGQYLDLRNAVLGEMLLLGELKGDAKKALLSKRMPKAGERGFFMRVSGNSIDATQRVDVQAVTTDKGGVTRIKVTPMFDTMTLVFDPKVGSGKIRAPKGERVAVIPTDFTFVPTTDTLRETDLVHDPRELAAVYLDKLQAEGATPVALKSAALDEFSINGTMPMDRVETIVKLAADYYISVDDAESMVKQANENGKCRVLIASTASLLKLAAEKEKSPKKKTTTVEEPAAAPAPAAPQDPMAGQGMDPAAMGMDPAAQAGQPGMDPAAMQAAAGPASPVDQAVQELQDEVNAMHEQQMALMAQKQQTLQQQLTALQAVAARAQEIAQGVPKEQSQAVQQVRAGTDPSAAAPPMDPMAGAAPAAPAGPPGQAAPVTGGAGPQMPMDPAMMQQASGLADPAMFDAAAIGSLAEHSSLKDLVSQYVPTLEKSIDHLGRILLTLWIKGSDLREQLGEETFSGLEDRLRSLFKGMGDLVLRVNQTSLALRDEGADPSAIHETT